MTTPTLGQDIFFYASKTDPAVQADIHNYFGLSVVRLAAKATRIIPAQVAVNGQINLHDFIEPVSGQPAVLWHQNIPHKDYVSPSADQNANYPYPFGTSYWDFS